MYAFHHHWQGEPVVYAHKGSYVGAGVLARITPVTVKAMAKKLVKENPAQAGSELELVLFTSTVASRPPPAGRVRDSAADLSPRPPQTHTRHRCRRRLELLARIRHLCTLTAVHHDC